MEQKTVKKKEWYNPELYSIMGAYAPRTDRLKEENRILSRIWELTQIERELTSEEKNEQSQLIDKSGQMCNVRTLLDYFIRLAHEGYKNFHNGPVTKKVRVEIIDNAIEYLNILKNEEENE